MRKHDQYLYILPTPEQTRLFEDVLEAVTHGLLVIRHDLSWPEVVVVLVDVLEDLRVEDLLPRLHHDGKDDHWSPLIVGCHEEHLRSSVVERVAQLGSSFEGAIHVENGAGAEHIFEDRSVDEDHRVLRDGAAIGQLEDLGNNSLKHVLVKIRVTTGQEVVDRLLQGGWAGRDGALSSCLHRALCSLEAEIRLHPITLVQNFEVEDFLEKTLVVKSYNILISLINIVF